MFNSFDDCGKKAVNFGSPLFFAQNAQVVKNSSRRLKSHL